MRTFRMPFVVAAILLFGGLTLAAQSADPLVATWTVNMAKSKYDPGPAPQSLTMTVTVDERGYTITQDQVGADGATSHAVILMKPDGKEYPVDAAKPTTVASSRIDARTYERVTRVEGVVTMTSRTVVSLDGKTRTTTTTGTDRSGRPVHELIVYDRK